MELAIGVLQFLVVGELIHHIFKKVVVEMYNAFGASPIGGQFHRIIIL